MKAGEREGLGQHGFVLAAVFQAKIGRSRCCCFRVRMDVPHVVATGFRKSQHEALDPCRVDQWCVAAVHILQHQMVTG